MGLKKRDRDMLAGFIRFRRGQSSREAFGVIREGKFFFE
jgi:hypothetical protein